MRLIDAHQASVHFFVIPPPSEEWEEAESFDCDVTFNCDVCSVLSRCVIGHKLGAIAPTHV